jgi:uncharacterized membrane protein YdbT with pleckstrin-like domain
MKDGGGMERELLRRRQSILSKGQLMFWPLLLAVLAWILKILLPDDVHVTVPLVVTGLMLVAWLVAWIAARTNTYVVYADRVFAQQKFISRATSEVRVAVVRSINVSQSLYARLFRIGDVVFKSAGDEEDVVFKGVPDPEGIKRVVQQQQSKSERRGREEQVVAEIEA